MLHLGMLASTYLHVTYFFTSAITLHWFTFCFRYVENSCVRLQAAAACIQHMGAYCILLHNFIIDDTKGVVTDEEEVRELLARYPQPPARNDARVGDCGGRSQEQAGFLRSAL